MSDMTRHLPVEEYQTSSLPIANNVQSKNGLLNALRQGLAPHKPVHKRVSDVLAVVLHVSARSRRMAMQPVNIELDVFNTTGRRAVVMMYKKKKEA